MSNKTMSDLLNELRTKQTADVEQIAKFKALCAALDETVRERASLIKLLEAGNNGEYKNHTLSQVWNLG